MPLKRILVSAAAAQAGGSQGSCVQSCCQAGSPPVCSSCPAALPLRCTQSHVWAVRALCQALYLGQPHCTPAVHHAFALLVGLCCCHKCGLAGPLQGVMGTSWAPGPPRPFDLTTTSASACMFWFMVFQLAKIVLQQIPKCHSSVMPCILCLAPIAGSRSW